MRKAVFGLIVLFAFGFVFAGCATTNGKPIEQTTLVITGLTGSKIQGWTYPEGKGGTSSATLGGSRRIDIINGIATMPLIQVNNPSPWSGNGGVYDIIIEVDYDTTGSRYIIRSKKLETGEVSIALTDFTKR
jgi:hypothetical protein